MLNLIEVKNVLKIDELKNYLSRINFDKKTLALATSGALFGLSAVYLL